MKFNTLSVVTALAFGIAASSSVAAQESTEATLALAETGVLVTADQAKGGRTSVALDVNNDTGASAVSFAVQLPKDATAVDVKSCTAEIPATHTGACRLVEGNRVAVILWSSENKALPSGLVSIGQFSYTSASSAKGLQATHVTLASAK